MKLVRTIRYSVWVLVAVAVLLMADRAWALDGILGETKEELKLKYDVSVRDLGNGRVWIIFTLTDEGRLKPVRSVDLQIPGRDKDKDGGSAPELSVSLAMWSTDAGVAGKRAHFELTKELAERAEIWLMAPQVEGKFGMEGYVHRIPIAGYMKNVAAAPAAAPAKPAAAAGVEAPAATPATQKKD